jgi:hypothetical protein
MPIDEYVGGLDVPVHVFLVVHVPKRSQQLPEDALYLDLAKLVRNIQQSRQIVRDVLQDQKQVPFVTFAGIAYVTLLTIDIVVVFCRVVVVLAVVVGTPVTSFRFLFVFVFSAAIRPFVIVVGIEVFDPFRTYHLDHPY